MILSQECQRDETCHLFLSRLIQVGQRIKQLVNRYKKWLKMKEQHRRLLSMEDRLLKDIGLSRADTVRISNTYTFKQFMMGTGPDNRQDDKC